MTYATFTKLRDGSWGLRYEGQLSPGEVVNVRTKSGEREEVTVKRVIFEKEGLCLATFFPKAKKADPWGDYADEVTF